jgi:hypothetical protein
MNDINKLFVYIMSCNHGDNMEIIHKILDCYFNQIHDILSSYGQNQ